MTVTSWVFRRVDGTSGTIVKADTWYNARQEAMVVLGCGPQELDGHSLDDVRPGKESPDQGSSQGKRRRVVTVR